MPSLDHEIVQEMKFDYLTLLAENQMKEPHQLFFSNPVQEYLDQQIDLYTRMLFPDLNNSLYYL